jgi:precorrin-2/cobalt-factor-2 C20-methyltransferase
LAKLYGIGIGPGDPTLITLKARDIIAIADVVCVPKAKNDGVSIALKIVSPYLDNQEILEVTMPMTADKELLTTSWQEAAAKVAEKLRAGKTVVFLTLGDVTIYSTFGYLADALFVIMPEAEIEMIPGITSFSAAAARLGIRLAEGSEPLLIVPDANETNIADIMPKFPNLVLMKVSAYWQELKDILAGKGAKAFLVSRIGQEGESIQEDITALTEKPDYLTLAIVKKRR